MRLLTVNEFRVIELDETWISKEAMIEIRKMPKHNILKKELLEILDILGICTLTGLKGIR